MEKLRKKNLSPSEIIGAEDHINLEHKEPPRLRSGEGLSDNKLPKRAIKLGNRVTVLWSNDV